MRSLLTIIHQLFKHRVQLVVLYFELVFVLYFTKVFFFYCCDVVKLNILLRSDLYSYYNWKYLIALYVNFDKELLIAIY